MIIHLILDDKFGQYTIKQFTEVNSSNNKFVIVGNETIISNIPLQWAKHIILLKENEFKTYVFSNIEKIKAIVFHGLNEEYKWNIIIELEGKVHLHWMFWGTDGYMLPHLRKKLLKPVTCKIRQKLSKTSILIHYVHNSGSLLFNIFAWLYKLKTNNEYFLKKLENAIRLVDSISSVVPQDYEGLCRKLNIKAPLIPFSYGSVKTLIRSNNEVNDNIKQLGNNILIGNSASIENNHLDAIIEIRQFEIGSRKIVVPLNYGESIPGYKNYIIEKGNEILGTNNFSPLINFLPLKMYNELLQNCSHTIMNHNKQQAMGNIITLLYYGTKLFMNKVNPSFQYLKDEGFIVFEMKEISQKHLDTKLSKKEMQHNRDLIHKLYNDDIVQEKTEQLYQYLMKC
ncbi:TDP-N-acetylfucosamine:lipid II N-acetylfucosaminyltransferase [Marinilabilia salmonicolor]|uniref:4-alpha-L-fucosyltransferase (Glycosyl transferase family 56) n=1 Tax=Marinilabilia salmonicolor TaxID=989 RepID=A0A368UJ71_9BACT|nr:TDP-N-acetylfucosamine:lipid II N-acetylfucosaminyltransferase [Marinilabilia salmonicolor]RCW27028.1 4-alpha-L-fucosyltransferase (glycosyl transferase family 56) [Marinilabilia salmonicolor]